MEELKGVVVMVHPGLNKDPYQMKGQIGTISLIDYENDDVYIKFKNEMLGLYDTGALLTLVPADVVVNKLQQDVEELMLNRLELGDILNIYLLNSSEQVEQQIKALELAMNYYTLKEAVVCTLRDRIALHLDDLDQSREPGIGR